MRIHMKQLDRVHFTAGLFLGLAALLAYAELFSVGAIGCIWFGVIRLLNSVAPRLPFSRLIHWMHAMTFEVPAFLSVAAMRFIPDRERVQGKGRPILLVHGYMNHSSVWRYLKKRLESFGLGPIYTISLGHPFKSIREYAEKVKVKAEEIAKETGRNDLILIGHSMGGLVSLWYAAKLAAPATVTDVITIASPLNGTPIAHIGLGQNAREMEPNSALLQEMRAEIANRRDVRFHHLATKSDQLVLPGYSAVIPQNNHMIYEDMGHASMLYSRRVTDQIVKWVGTL